MKSGLFKVIKDWLIDFIGKKEEIDVKISREKSFILQESKPWYTLLARKSYKMDKLTATWDYGIISREGLYNSVYE